MRCDRISYYFDFVFCPPLICFFLFISLRELSIETITTSLLYALLGFFGWTLIEYIVHRWLFHHAPIFRQLHEAHHAEPQSYIASPPSLIPIATILIAFGLFWIFGIAAAAATSAGALVGYILYSFVHHSTHHLRRINNAYFIKARRRHLRHHGALLNADFGVTTDFWDRVFGTASRYGRWSLKSGAK